MMQSKTPKFDAALNLIFADLVPHERVCKQCNANFCIESGDIEFLKKLRVPPPTLCPRCRMQRRLAYRLNLKPVFYRKVCAAPGHSEKILTFYDADNPVPVYDDAFYRREEWDATSFGVVYDLSRPLFTQLSHLFDTVPHQALHHDSQSINSDYVVVGVGAKNCYYVSVPVLSENLQYGNLGDKSKDSIDFLNLDHSEQCYSCVRMERSYRCTYCIASADCIDSFFLYDCKNCTHCFMSSNLRNRSYCWNNEQLSKEAYEARMVAVDLGSYKILQSYREQFKLLLQSAIHKNLDVLKCEQCVGNQLRNCKNCVDTFLVLGGAVNLRFVAYIASGTGANVSDLMDFWGGGDITLCYETTGVAVGSQIRFSALLRNVREVEYCMECTNVDFCFGCFGLRSKKFCIFNKQYTEEEYWPRVDELKTAMLAYGEYGEFLPIPFSPFPYNDGNAMIEFPLTRDEVVAHGWKWHDKKESNVDLASMSIIHAAELPDHMRDVNDDILQKAIICAETGRPFRLTSYELAFYRQHNLPLPRVHPDARIQKLLEHRLPYRLFNDTCKKCGKKIRSGYDPAKNYKVYCESCYQAEFL